MKILLTGSTPDWAAEELTVAGHEVTSMASDAYVKEADFCAGIKDYDVYVSGGLETCSRAVIEAANNLKAIVFLGVDFKAYIDSEAASKKNIPIFNTPGANSRGVAELAFMLMLLGVRRGARMLADAQQKTWKLQTGSELQGKTLGLIGSGNIAREMAEIGKGFGMKLLYWGRSGKKQGIPATYESLENVLAHSDILSLHVPKEAGIILDEKTLKSMKPHAVLINTCPASLVDASALYNALKNDQLQAAIFDTFYTEGEKAWVSEQAKLFELGAEKFFITPHAGWRTVETDSKMYMAAINHIKGLVPRAARVGS